MTTTPHAPVTEPAPAQSAGPQPDARQKIRDAFDRNRQALALRPAIGQGTATTRVRLSSGLSCVVEDGPWKLNVDMTTKHGGENTGPNPGVLGRAALGSCLAMSYARFAAFAGLSFASLEVEIQADYDARGEYGIDNTPAGYLGIRYLVKIESNESLQDILDLLDTAEAHTPYLQVFRQPQNVRRIVEIDKPRS